MSEIQVIITDDNVTVRQGLSSLINGTDGFRCIGTYADAETLLEKLKRTLPNVILMDIKMPGMSGIQALKHIKAHYANINIIMLTVYDDNELILEALLSGADGYLVKHTQPIRLLESIREVCSGGSPMNANIAKKIVSLLKAFHSYNVTEDQKITLSERERDILTRLSKGYTHESIADDLHIHISTIKYHLRNIYTKLHASTKSEAIAKAIRNRII
ncbi:response regulator transcription factor [bacterium]|nr:response regulator transcription factor [bacterium]NUN45986.1 response regulator transcription factor [bacterium]